MQSASEVSNEECEDDLVMQKCIGSSSEERTSPCNHLWLVTVVPQELLAQKETLLCMSGRKLVATVR